MAKDNRNKWNAFSAKIYDESDLALETEMSLRDIFPISFPRQN